MAEGAFSAASQLCLSLCLPSPTPLLPCCSPSCQSCPPPGSSPFVPQPSAHLPPSACSQLLSYLLAVLAMSPGAAGRIPHNPSSIRLHKHPLHPGGAEVTWSLLSGSEDPPWPLLQAFLVGHMLGHQCGQLQPPSSSCLVCAGMTLPELSTACLSDSALPGFGLTSNTTNRTLIYGYPLSL